MKTISDLTTLLPQSQAQINVRELIKELLKSMNIDDTEADTLILEPPPPNVNGDVAVPCFSFAKAAKKPPVAIAEEIATKKSTSGFFSSTQAVGSYLNVSLKRPAFTESVITQINSEGDTYGYSKSGTGKSIMVEYSSPNTNKPQHIGHIRNNLLGSTSASLLKAIGFDVIKTSIINDRGIHICKSMLAYQKWGEGKTPQSTGRKPDHFVGNYYVMFEQHLNNERKEFVDSKKVNISNLSEQEKKEFEETFLEQSPLMIEARDMLHKWEKGDPQVVSLWRQMNDWVYLGFDKTYRELGIDFDKTYYESDIYKGGRDIIARAVSKGQLKKSPSGAIYAPLEEQFGLPDKVVLRADDTSLYITQDLNLAQAKFNDFHPDFSVYCIGSEQDLYMQQLFAILKLIDFPHADKLYHLSYGMVNLPEGKMKSREGKVVDADDLIQDMITIAREMLTKRYPELSQKELDDRSRIIGLSAIKFYILAVKKQSSMMFDPSKSIDFEGKTGPYIQYSYARAESVIRKANLPVEFSKINWNTIELNDKEWALVWLLSEFPTIIHRSAVQTEPAILTDALFTIAQAFNQLYHTCPILKSSGNTRLFRLALTKATQQVLSNGLKLLGIETLSKM